MLEAQAGQAGGGIAGLARRSGGEEESGERRRWIYAGPAAAGPATRGRSSSTSKRSAQGAGMGRDRRCRAAAGAKRSPEQPGAAQRQPPECVGTAGRACRVDRAPILRARAGCEQRRGSGGEVQAVVHRNCGERARRLSGGVGRTAPGQRPAGGPAGQGAMRQEARPGAAGAGCRWGRTRLSSAEARRSACGAGAVGARGVDGTGGRGYRRPGTPVGWQRPGARGGRA